MINTIFYFADTQLEYLDNYAQGSVKPHTICFAKDTKTIWRDGQRFSGLRLDEVDNEIHNLTDEAISDVVQAAAEEKIRLNGLINTLDNDISNVATDLTTTATAIRNEVRNGELYTSEGWDPKVNAYLKTVGLWDYGTGDTQHVTKWSTLRQSVSDVSSEVSRVEAKADGYNTTLNSKINLEITDRGTAITNLSNTFANTTGDLQDVIEWMYSGLHSGAAQDMSYAEIIAAGKNGASSAISDLRTSIETTSDGKYVAQSSLTSSVDNAISGIINAASGTYANTSVFSKIDENSNNIAAIATKVTGDSSLSTVAAKLNGMTASLVTTANLDSSIAALSALAKDTVGNAIAATIFAKANEQGSNITLNADKIYLAGQTWALYINALGITARNVNVTDEDDNVVAKIDSTGRARFMNGNLYIPWRTWNMDGSGYSYNPTLVFVDTETPRKTVYGTWGINCQDNYGIILGAATVSLSGAGLTSYDGSGAPYNDLMSFGVNKTHQVTSRSDVLGPGYSQFGNYKNIVVNGQNKIAAANEGLFKFEGFSVMDALVNDVVYFRTSAFVLHSSLFTSDASLTVSSDERLKTIIDNVQPSVEDISKIRTVDFLYKDDNKNIVRSGSIAQDWQTVLPNVVSENQDGYLTLDYGSAALISAVTAAKEIVALKKENEDLKQRLAAIEAKLNI